MKKKVLLVDDNKDFALLFQAKYSEIGQIEHASSYAEAVGMIESHAWDLFLLDFVLDNSKTCFDLLPLIKNRASRVPVILVTAHADKDMAIRALNSGINGLIEKPVQEEQLKDRLWEIGWNEVQLALDERSRCVQVSGVSYPLTKVEFMILRRLMDSKNQLVTRKELEDCIWGGQHIVKNSLDTHLYNIKRKVPELKGRLSSIHGTGYLLKA